ncbi:MAG TPA: ArsA-related P-loop ATPase [Steroidobacteraceae bacterium]|nr:ArsA-related P-loop ATPase [Steroidobacteraceae bacterium]
MTTGLRDEVHAIHRRTLPFSVFHRQGRRGKTSLACAASIHLAGLDKQKARYAEAVAALADTQRTRIVLVARAQPSALREVERTRKELQHIGLGEQYLVINGVMPAGETTRDPLAAAIYRREQAALAEIPESLKHLPRDEVPLKPFDLIGVSALRQLLSREAAASSSEQIEVPAVDLPTLGTLVDEIASGDHGLVMVMGKGGVGKTTIAAAIALGLAERGLPVHLTTSDPAAHLKQTVVDESANLTVSRIDPRMEVDRYRREVMKSKGAKLDDQGRALLEEDLRSPCTEEIAVFQAFSRVVREAGKRFVIMDTAPTGHTLLLLDTTGAYHREMTRQMQSTGLRYTTALMQLQDPKYTKVIIVTLAETTPVLEAANLQADLNRADIHPWAWVINNSIGAAAARGSVTSPMLLQRARNELPKIEAVAQQYSERYAVVPLLPQEPVGANRLLLLTRKS